MQRPEGVSQGVAMSVTSSIALQQHPTFADPTHMQESKEQLPTDNFRVSLDADENPQALPVFRKWAAVLAISFASLCVATSSSIASIHTKRLNSTDAFSNIRLFSRKTMSRKSSEFLT